MIEPGLRFAPLIRVSTERQEQQGESLKTQQADLETDIKAMGGTITKWYAGQEHATPDHERMILDTLMQDAQAKKFDAVIVWSIDRWSRDNARGSKDLQFLQTKGIRFFERRKEFNLKNEVDYFQIALFGIIGQMQAQTQTRKSLLNRIARAKQGIPTGGKIPYGRTFNKKKGIWGIDRDKQDIIEDAARRYLEGESLTDIANQYGFNMPNLNKILKRRCGEYWQIRFVAKQLNIDEIISIKIPRLLPEETIKRIHERSEANKTFTHGQIKYPYLLSRMIFCEECGFAIFGQANHNGKLYYRHPSKRGCKTFNSIPGDIIEGSVISDIFQMLGDRPKIDQAIMDAIPDHKELEELKSRIKHNEKELLKNKRAKDRLLDQVEKGNISGSDIKDRMIKLKETEVMLSSQIEILKTKCESIPSKEDIKIRSDMLLCLKRDFLRMKKHLDEEMTFDDKRKLLQYVFNGKDANGKRCGVYVRKADNGLWIYEIKGMFHEMGITKKINHVNIAPKIYVNEDENVFEPLEDSEPVIDSSEESDALTAEAKASFTQRTQEHIEQDMLGKCHAYYGLDIYQR